MKKAENLASLKYRTSYVDNSTVNSKLAWLFGNWSISPLE